MLELGVRDGLAAFPVELDRGWRTLRTLVIAVMRRAYPSLKIPFHARWRHFVLGGVDRWAAHARARSWSDRAARGTRRIRSCHRQRASGCRRRNQWRYRDRMTGQGIGRSEGLALASLDMFASGAFSSDARDPFRVDADVIAKFPLALLQDGFQVADANPLVGFDGRADLLRQARPVVSERPEVLRASTRRAREDCSIISQRKRRTDELRRRQSSSKCCAQLGPIWPSRLELAGIPLGDCWRHPSIRALERLTGSCRCTNFRNGWPIP